MPRFAANLTLLWPELPPLERFAAAARAGFSAVEILFVHDLDRGAVARALREHGLRLHLFDPGAGDWAKGERGLLCLPGRQDEFRETIRQAVADALQLGTPKLNVLAGLAPAGADPAELRRIAVQNLREAAGLCARAGLLLLVENINRVDMPGYFCATPDEAASLVSAAGSPALRLQLDQYHAGMMGLDARAAFERHRPLIEHVQIADVPGRHQPGTGSQPIAAFLQTLDQLGYGGCVGLEYKPQGPTDASLSWLPRERRG